VRLVSEVFALDAHVQTRATSATIEISIGSSIVGRLLLALCATGSHDKQIHPALHGAPREFVEGLLRGYAWTDGCVDDKSFSTVSKPLALTVYTFALRAGLSPTLFEAPGRPGLIKGRAIHAIGPRYTLRFRGEDRVLFDRIVGTSSAPTAPGYATRNWASMSADGEGFYRFRVKSVESREYEGPVHNFEVEGAQSYTANGLVVHNCAYRLPGYSSNELFGERDPITGIVNNNPKRFLPLDGIVRVLDDCVRIGLRACEITGGGESTLHPEITRILECVVARDLEGALITHGLLLARKGLFDLAGLCAWTRISIDAATENVYGAVRPSLGGPHGENLRVALRALEGVRAARDVVNPANVLGAGFVVQPANWHEIYDAVRLYREHGADNVRISGAFTPEKDRLHAPYREAAEELERRAVADFDGKGGFRVYGRFHAKCEDLSAPPDYPDCHYQKFTTYLGGDGWLYRCCVQSYSLHGRLAYLPQYGWSLKAAWDAPETQAKLKNFDARSCGLCQYNNINRSIAKILREPPVVVDPNTILHRNFV
jgi:MoaA/NifB/PqqE/SkfB family radical SAM enzyme